MKDIIQRIDKLTDDLVIELMKKLKLKSKKEVIDKCVQFCYVNKINLKNINEKHKELNTLDLYKNLKFFESNVMKKLELLPFDLKKIIDSDDEFHPFFENYDFIIKKYENFIELNTLNNDFLNSLSEEEKYYFLLSKERISKF